jgi:tryptophanyl-tRNA synthetase
MSIIFSGVQPTGNLHLGNYLGAIRNWVAMQNRAAVDAKLLFCVVDQHAITVPQDPKQLRQSILEVTAAYIACGIDPKRSVIFNQSTVPGHAQLNWVLACHAPLGWLNRMTQFKEKSGKHKDQAVLGLYAYPVLMAADILLYRATHVPVGEDQKQHLELARDLAGAYNRHYGVEFFPLPEPIILGQAARIMSLRDGSKKMSKSDESDYSRINLTDDADTIALKIQKAKTDPLPLPASAEELATRPEAENLLGIYAALSDQDIKAVVAQFAGQQFSGFKKQLTELAVEQLSPITQTMRRLLADPQYLHGVLRAGSDAANHIAQPNLVNIYDTVGFWRA